MDDQFHAVRQMLTRDELYRAGMGFRTDRLKDYARRDLFTKLLQSIDLNAFVIMFSEEEITDRKSMDYGCIIISCLAYPKSRFNGGVFA